MRSQHVLTLDRYTTITLFRFWWGDTTHKSSKQNLSTDCESKVRIPRKRVRWNEQQHWLHYPRSCPAPWDWVPRRPPTLWTGLSSPRLERVPSPHQASLHHGLGTDLGRAAWNVWGLLSFLPGHLRAEAVMQGHWRVASNLISPNHTEDAGQVCLWEDRQGFEFLALVCTKDFSRLSPDLQLKHVSWPLNGIPMMPQLPPRKFQGRGWKGGKMHCVLQAYSWHCQFRVDNSMPTVFIWVSFSLLFYLLTKTQDKHFDCLQLFRGRYISIPPPPPLPVCWQRSNVNFSKNKKWKVYKYRTQNLQQCAITPSQRCV